MGGGRIDCYIDIGGPLSRRLTRLRKLTQSQASMYSYLAFVDLLANQEKLAAHGVTVEYGIMPSTLSHRGTKT